MGTGGVRLGQVGQVGQVGQEGETELSLPWAWLCGEPENLPGLERGRTLVHLLLIWFGIISNAL